MVRCRPRRAGESDAPMFTRPLTPTPPVRRCGERAGSVRGTGIVTVCPIGPSLPAGPGAVGAAWAETMPSAVLASSAASESARLIAGPRSTVR